MAAYEQEIQGRGLPLLAACCLLLPSAANWRFVTPISPSRRGLRASNSPPYLGVIR
jgi:hypothetical protein